jgi:branched-chain amino acid transport system substrate-binding protein
MKRVNRSDTKILERRRRTMKKRGRTLLGVAISLLVLIPPTLEAADTVRIGMLLPFTGPLAQEGRQTWEGFSVAADIVNAKGGIWGKKVEFVRGDSVTPDSAIAEMERLINVEKLNVIAGGYSGSRVFAASEISEKYKKIYWVSTAAADNITARGFKYIFRYNAATSTYGKIQVRFAGEMVAPALGKKPEDLRAAVIHEDSLWGTPVSQGELEEIKKVGLKLVSKESYSNKTVDLSSLIMKLRAAKPDMVFITGYVNDTILFWRQCKELDFNFAALSESGSTISNAEWLDTFGKDANYTLTLALLPVGNPSVLSPKGQALHSECLRLFAEKYKMRPMNLQMLGFEAGHILLTEVLPMAGSLDPEKVREAALKVNRSWKDSVIGMGARYAPPGHPMAGQNLEATQIVNQWQNGKLVAVYPKSVALGNLQVPMPTWDERKKMQ